MSGTMRRFAITFLAILVLVIMPGARVGSGLPLTLGQWQSGDILRDGVVNPGASDVVAANWIAVLEGVRKHVPGPSPLCSKSSKDLKILPNRDVDISPALPQMTALLPHLVSPMLIGQDRPFRQVSNLYGLPPSGARNRYRRTLATTGRLLPGQIRNAPSAIFLVFRGGRPVCFYSGRFPQPCPKSVAPKTQLRQFDFAHGEIDRPHIDEAPLDVESMSQPWETQKMLKISFMAAAVAALALVAGGHPSQAEQRKASYNFTPARYAPDYKGKRTVSFTENYKPGMIVIKTSERKLYYVLKGGKAIEYGVGVGRQGFSWSGSANVGRKAVWPTWTPPPEMREREPHLPISMKGGPKNPLGARAIYLYQGGRDTLYRIHGTNAAQTIGMAVSSGCIRLLNEEVIDLYKKVKVGAKVVVM